MINQNFIYLGFILNLIGGGSYILDTVKGKTKPNRITWFLWALAPCIAGFAQVAQGVGLPSLMTFSVGFIPLCVFIASFFNKKAVWKLGTLDYICGVLSICGLALWWVTKIGNIAILLSIFTDALAAVPTIVKSYRTPESESYGVYLAGLANAGITLLTVLNWNFATWGFPVYMVFLNFLIFALIKFRLGKRHHNYVSSF